MIRRRLCFLLFVLLTAGMVPLFSASALTVRTKADLRRWQTVTDRMTPLGWAWQRDADAATLTFSNRLTRASSSVTVVRTPGAVRGDVPQPIAAEAPGEGYVAVTLVQTAGGAEVSRETADLAYVPGAAGRVLTVRTKAVGAWGRVPTPRLSGFDAHWWNVAGASGYEVLWATPPGPHPVVREFEGAGVVDAAMLCFGRRGFAAMIR